MLYLTFLKRPWVNHTTSTVHPTYFGIFLAVAMLKFVKNIWGLIRQLKNCKSLQILWIFQNLQVQSVKVNWCVWTKCHLNLLKIGNIVKFLKALSLQNTSVSCFRSIRGKIMLLVILFLLTIYVSPTMDIFLKLKLLKILNKNADGTNMYY